MNRRPINTVDISFMAVEAHIKKTSVENIIKTMKGNYFRWVETVDKSFPDFLVTFYSRCYDWWGSFDPSNGDYQMIEQRAACLKEHIDDIAEMYFSFNDYASRMTLNGLLLFWFNFDMEYFSRMQERKFDDYFDLDVFQCGRNEVFVDVGVYTGDTILKYLANYGDRNYKRIIGYEINRRNADTAMETLKDKRDIDIRLKAVSDKNGVMYVTENDSASQGSFIHTDGSEYTVEAVTLDDDINEPITFLKMDIEGAEFAALHGAKNHIIHDRPKMAICIYHSNDDLWRIFKFLNEICVDYNFFMRYWSSGPEYLAITPVPIEYTLLCVPK